MSVENSIKLVFVSNFIHEDIFWKNVEIPEINNYP
jgi:hypothetical protein